MKTKTKILIVEHDPNDIEMIQHELKNGKVNYISEIVQTAEAYENALHDFVPDIILSDYSLPTFSGPEAFRLKEAMAPNTPFIFVSGTIGEENSIELIKNGATDFVLKERLFTIVIKVNRALKEAKEKKEKSKTARALTQSEGRLARAQQIAHIGSWELNFATGVAIWSDEACRIYGFDTSDNQHSFDTWLSFVHPDDAAYVMKLIKVSQQNFRSDSFDHRIIRKDGTERHIHSESKFELDSNGKPIGLYGIAQDITERKISEKKLAASEQHFRSLIENISDAIVLINENARVVYQSPSTERISGFALSDLEDKPLFEFIHPDDLENCLEFFQQLYSYPGIPKQNQYRIRHKQGHYIWIEGTITNLLGDENIQAFIANYRDVTEKKLAEMALQESKNLVQNIYNASLDAVIIIDEQGIITKWDTKSEILFGWKENEVSGSRLSAVVIPERYREMHEQGIKHYTKTEEGPVLGKTIEIRALRKNGSEFDISLSITAVKINNQTQFIGFIRDISGRKKAEEELQALNTHLEERVQERTADLTEANMALEAFNSTVSHDLRAPVRAVNSFARIIQQEYGTKIEPGLKELIGYIEESGKRMAGIIDDLLKLSKYGQEKLKLEPVNMTRLVNGIWLNISRHTPHMATLELAELCGVKVDMSMIQQVIVNLLSNAIKYSSKTEKPVIKVWSEQTEDHCTFYFQDNGAGFDMKNYDRLFGAFQRLHNTRDFEGTGIGLTLVKRIIEKHGGTVGAEARVGEGATFYFTIPSK